MPCAPYGCLDLEHYSFTVLGYERHRVSFEGEEKGGHLKCESRWPFGPLYFVNEDGASGGELFPGEVRVRNDFAEGTRARRRAQGEALFRASERERIIGGGFIRLGAFATALQGEVVQLNVFDKFQFVERVGGGMDREDSRHTTGIQGVKLGSFLLQLLLQLCLVSCRLFQALAFSVCGGFRVSGYLCRPRRAVSVVACSPDGYEALSGGGRFFFRKAIHLSHIFELGGSVIGADEEMGVYYQTRHDERVRSAK